MNALTATALLILGTWAGLATIALVIEHRRRAQDRTKGPWQLERHPGGQPAWKVWHRDHPTYPVLWFYLRTDAMAAQEGLNLRAASVLPQP